jgi:hypothetical protein
MKLQYRYYQSASFQYTIQLYCDGWFIKSYKVYCDELDDEIDKIEIEGYKLGYTEEEVEIAKQKYEKILNNLIAKEVK